MASLIICEKPKVAEKMAQALSEGEVRREQLYGISHFRVSRGGKELVIAPAVGHLYTLRQVEKGSGYPVFNIEWVPSWKAEKGAKFTKDYLLSLQSLAKEADECINACDFDIEGSLIGYNVIRFSAPKKGTAKRMKFSALTQEDLVEAYENMLPLDERNAIAGETRHILDWFWGINLSRALMGAVRAAGTYKIMSIGRVQGPALHMLAERELEISAFKPEPYWQLFAACNALKFQHEIERFFKKEEAEIHRQASEANRANGVVEKVTRTKKKLPPNPPFDLTSLQVEAFKCFGFSPAATLEMAQTLYEASLISYPRTASQKLPAKLNFPKILAKLSQNHAYAEKAKALIAANRFKPLEGAKEDPAHPAIHPTGLAPYGIGEREMRLYDLIVKRFLACFAEFATREGMRVDISLGPERYYVAGARTAEKGWIDYYEPYAKFEDVTLPDFTEKSKIAVEQIEMPQKETQPPKRYTEASAIQALEKKNLGTKATRAVVLETLHKRGYIKGRKSLEVTLFGLEVYGVLMRWCREILDEKLTREFEEKMDGITEGKIDEDEVIHEAEGALEIILKKFKKSEPTIGKELVGVFREQRAEDETLGKCPLCKTGDLRIMHGRATGKQFVSCNNYPQCKQSYPLPQHALIIKTPKICDKCNTPIYTVRRSGRRDFEMCLDPKCPTKANWGKPKPSTTVVIDSKTGKEITPAPAAPTKTASASTALPTAAKPASTSPSTAAKPAIAPAAPLAQAASAAQPTAAPPAHAAPVPAVAPPVHAAPAPAAKPKKKPARKKNAPESGGANP